MTFSTSAKPLSYYVDGELTDQLIDSYGCFLEGIERHWQLIFRASLTAYLAFESIYDHETNSISCAEASIACAGGDDYNIWEENPELADYIQAACELSEDGIESLIEALTAQLRGGSATRVQVKDSELHLAIADIAQFLEANALHSDYSFLDGGTTLEIYSSLLNQCRKSVEWQTLETRYGAVGGHLYSPDEDEWEVVEEGAVLDFACSLLSDWVH